MSQKSTAISVRITPQDSEFIANLEMEEAITPSEKIRALLKMARENHNQERDLPSCLNFARNVVDPVINQLKKVELEEQLHSELVTVFSEWLIHLLGYIGTLEKCEMNKHTLLQIEAEIGHRLFRLMGSVVRMGVTHSAPCYNPQLIRNSLPPLQEILSIIQEHTEKEKELAQ